MTHYHQRPGKKRFPIFGIITLLYFGLGFISISLSLLAIFCFVTPFIIAYFTRTHAWCTSYCPRGFFFSVLGKSGRGKAAPEKLVQTRFKKAVLTYFIVNLTFITLSTAGVASGNIEPMDYIRLFIVIPTYIRLPQVIEIASLPPALLHLSYRFYSIMLSSTLFGTALALLYKPRTWCTLCPVRTINQKIIGK